MTDEIQIDNGIPVSSKRWSANGRLAEKMRPNDSALLPTKREANLVARALRHLGHKSAFRKVDDGYRVWRLS